MLRNVVTKPIIAVCVIGLLLAGVGGSTFGATATSTAGNGTIKNEGPCDKSLSKVPVAALIVGETPTLDLQDQADALVASAKVFNKKYNGMGGHCFDLNVCDVKDDPNTAADCARQVAASDMVATLNDTTPFGGPEVVSILKAAGIPRVDVSPGTDELKDSELLRDRRRRRGHHLHDGAAAHAGRVQEDLHDRCRHADHRRPQVDHGHDGEGYGAEIIGLSKVPGGTTDFQQFVTRGRRTPAPIL